MTVNNHSQIVYYTYIDANGKVQADKMTAQTSSNADTLEMEYLQVVEEMIASFHPGCTSFLIMFVENT